MPIHASWKPMASGMRSTYGSGNICRDFTDGTSVCMSKKAWTVFFATLNKHGWKDTSPTPKSFSATVAEDAIEETVQELVDWYDETKKHKKRKRHKKKKHKHTHTHPIIITNPSTSHSSQWFHPTNFPHIPQNLPSPNPQFFQLTKEKYTEEEVKAIVEWYESKRKKKNGNVPIKRFEARTHPAPPKGKKILKPYPIHIMPKHMQTVEDKYNGLFDESDGEPKWVTLAKKIIASKKGNPKMKEYWQKRLDAYKPTDCPKVKKK